jgi:hypothetical protein
MRITTRAVMSVLAFAVIGALPSGCSTDKIDSGSQALAVKYTPNPTGAGRFERASFGIMVIRVLPADPELAAIYGTTPLSLRFDPFAADLTQTQAVTFSDIALATGSYRVVRIDFSSPSLVDTDVSTTPLTCIDGVAAIPSGPASSQVPPTTTFVNPDSLDFTVSPGQTTLSLTVDVPGLIAGYESSFTCNPDCGGGQPCLTAFNQTTYADTLLASISFH